jgi:hypothetical protein
MGVLTLMPLEPFCGTTPLPGQQMETIFHPLILGATSHSIEKSPWEVFFSEKMNFCKKKKNG